MESYFSKLIHKFSVFLFDSFMQIVKVPNFKNSDSVLILCRWIKIVVKMKSKCVARWPFIYHTCAIAFSSFYCQNLFLKCHPFLRTLLQLLYYKIWNILWVKYLGTKYVGWGKMSNDFMNVLFHPHIYCYYVVSTNSYVKITFKKIVIITGFGLSIGNKSFCPVWKIYSKLIDWKYTSFSIHCSKFKWSKLLNPDNREILF